MEFARLRVTGVARSRDPYPVGVKGEARSRRPLHVVWAQGRAKFPGVGSSRSGGVNVDPGPLGRAGG